MAERWSAERWSAERWSAERWSAERAGIPGAASEVPPSRGLARAPGAPARLSAAAVELRAQAAAEFVSRRGPGGRQIVPP
jgi:hypothetical protein